MKRKQKQIRVRACVAVVHDERLLLVPHYDTDAAPVQRHLPGGGVAFGESRRTAARREALEETGLDVEVAELVGVSEVVTPERPWHSVTTAFAGTARDGVLAAENGHTYGTKTPRGFGQGELATIEYHPRQIINMMIGTLVE